MHQAQHRTEDLDSGKLTARVDIIEDCWPQEVAALVVWDRSIAPINEDLRPLAHAFPDQRLNALLALSRDERPHLDLRRKTVTDLAPGRHFGNVFPEDRASFANCDRHRGCQTALTCAAKGRVGNDAGSHVHIGIRQYDDRILGASLALGALTVGCCPAIHVPCYR